MEHTVETYFIDIKLAAILRYGYSVYLRNITASEWKTEVLKPFLLGTIYEFGQGFVTLLTQTFCNCAVCSCAC